MAASRTSFLMLVILSCDGSGSERISCHCVQIFFVRNYNGKTGTSLGMISENQKNETRSVQDWETDFYSCLVYASYDRLRSAVARKNGRQLRDISCFDTLNLRFYRSRTGYNMHGLKKNLRQPIPWKNLWRETVWRAQRSYLSPRGPITCFLRQDF